MTLLPNPPNVVEVTGLTRQFGATLALDNLSLVCQPGLVYGLVGANGAGKTTLIKHLLGLLRAKHGRVRVFGLDPVTQPVQVLQRIGYLSEDRDLPEWMRIHELLRYTQAFHPLWDPAYARELLELFQIDPSKKVKNLSKGMRAQIGLIVAVAHRPELLVLDEPSTGLDAVIRKDILNTLVRTVADDGRTAIFSSHLLDEVEQMSDRIFMIDHGKLVLEGDIDDIKLQHARMILRFESPRKSIDLPQLLSAEMEAGLLQSGQSWKVVCQGPTELNHQAALAIGAEILQSRSASLQEIFVARAGRSSTEHTVNSR